MAEIKFPELAGVVDFSGVLQQLEELEAAVMVLPAVKETCIFIVFPGPRTPLIWVNYNQVETSGILLLGFGRSLKHQYFIT